VVWDAARTHRLKTRATTRRAATIAGSPNKGRAAQKSRPQATGGPRVSRVDRRYAVVTCGAERVTSPQHDSLSGTVRVTVESCPWACHWQTRQLSWSCGEGACGAGCDGDD